MIDSPLTVPAVLIALVLVFSGVAKLKAPTTTAEAFVSLRLPAWLRTMKAPALLPWGELVLAALLLVTSGWLAILAGVAAVVLFVVYLVIIVRALTFNEPVRCSCFGELGLGDVTVFTAVRNVILVALSALVLFDATRGTSVLWRIAHFTAAEWVWLAFVLLAMGLTWLITGAHGPAANTAAAPATAAPTGRVGTLLSEELLDGTGTPRALHTLAVTDKKTLIAHVSPGCGPCETVISTLRTWQHEARGVHTVLVIPASPEAGMAALSGAEDFEIYFDPDQKLTQSYQMGTPSAIVLDGQGRLETDTVGGRPAVENLLRQLDSNIEVAEPQEVRFSTPTTRTSPAGTPAASAPVPPEPAAGTDAGDELGYERRPNPFVRFSRDEDTKVALHTLVGPMLPPAVFIQVSPGCGPCEKVLEQVKQWNEDVKPIQLFLVVSSHIARQDLGTRGFDTTQILVDDDAALAFMMQLANPGLFAAGADGYMLAGPVHGSEQVTGAMEDIIAEIRGAYPDPEVELPTASGSNRERDSH